MFTTQNIESFANKAIEIAKSCSLSEKEELLGATADIAAIYYQILIKECQNLIQLSELEKSYKKVFKTLDKEYNLTRKELKSAFQH